MKTGPILLLFLLTCAVVHAQFDYTTENGEITITGGCSDGAVVIPTMIDDLPVTSIEREAFYRCSSVTSVIIPNSVTNIGPGLFWDCVNLTSVYFEGNAPVFYTGYRGVFDPSSAVILYHRPEATGWAQNNGGRPTALWTDPPDYEEWIQLSDLPPDSTETDDPDQDDMTNHAEMLAGTDPTDPNSVLAIEWEPRLDDLTDEDKTPIESNQHAHYAGSVPGKTYAVQWAESPTGPWNVDKVVTATTTQTRFVFDKPQGQGFYRVILAQ